MATKKTTTTDTKKIEADKASEWMSEVWPAWDMETEIDGRKLERPTNAEIAALQEMVHETKVPQPPVATKPKDGLRYYLAASTHHRNDMGGHTGPGAKIESKFTGMLPVVRMKLPLDEAALEKKIPTLFGELIVEDRLLPTVADVNVWLKRYFNPATTAPKLGRVDLVTPARSSGQRFAAVAFYLCYSSEKSVPAFYILEAGIAAGQPKMLYLAKELKGSTVHDSHYKPTMLASEHHTYAGELEMDGDEPLQLQIKAFGAPMKVHTEKDHYLTVTVRYQPLTDDKAQSTPNHPWAILGEAAARIIKIAEAKGVKPDLTNRMAELFFKKLNPYVKESANHWQQKPTKK